MHQLNFADKPLIIASSAGGPQALRLFLSSLPTGLPVAGVIVQHMSMGFTRLLSENLQRACTYAVREAVDGDVLRPGLFLVAPGSRHLAFDARGRARIDDGPPINSVRPAADVSMTTLARVYQSRLTAVVLTGMGSDGLQGARAIDAAGGTVLAQDQESSFAYFMPRAVTEAGLVDAVGPPQKLALLVAARASGHRPQRGAMER